MLSDGVTQYSAVYQVGCSLILIGGTILLKRFGKLVRSARMALKWIHNAFGHFMLTLDSKIMP